MKLRQLKIDFNPEGDRLLMHLSTSEGRGDEAVADAALRQAALAAAGATGRGCEPAHQDPGQSEARKALLSLEHEQAVARADFSKPYEAEPVAMPLGAEPLLLARIQTGHDANGLPVLALRPAEGQGLTLSFDSVLLHSVVPTAAAAVKKTDWDIELKLPGSEPQPDQPARRTIN